MFERLRDDFQLAIIVLFGALSVVAILPFAVFRFATGQPWVGLLDLLLCVPLLGAAVHAWRTGRTQAAGLVLIVTMTIGLALVAGAIGRSAVLWVYCAIVAAFFIAPRSWAVASSSVLILSILLRQTMFPTHLEATTFAVTAALVSLFAFIFAWRTEIQRDKLEAMASQDVLTGAGTRRLMDVELQQVALAGSGRYGLALIDLDRFKQVNDRHGHEAGDAVLREFAAIVRDSVRKFDRLYRFGGEEFVLLIGASREAELVAALDKLHRQLRERLLGPSGQVTVSIGAAMQRPGESVADWLARADAALYRAKRGGRNRLVVDGEDVSELLPAERRGGGPQSKRA
jgi:diguanylate cyclase